MLHLPSLLSIPMHWSTKINSIKSSGPQDAPPWSTTPSLQSPTFRPTEPRCSHQPTPTLVTHSSCASSYNFLEPENKASNPTSTPASLLAEQDCSCKCPRVPGASMERLRAMTTLWGPSPSWTKREFQVIHLVPSPCLGTLAAT